jgi:hypothetical protein
MPSFVIIDEALTDIQLLSVQARARIIGLLQTTTGTYRWIIRLEILTCHNTIFVDSPRGAAISYLNYLLSGARGYYEQRSLL